MLPGPIRRAALCLALALGGTGAGAAAAAVPVEALAMTQVAPGVHVQQGRQEAWGIGQAANVGNLGFIVGKRCVAVIDTGGSPEVGRRLRAAVRATTELPVCYVITTHAHPDHLLGHAAFTQDTPKPVVVAHARLGPALSARERAYRNSALRDLGQALGADDIVYPDLAVAREQVLDLGERRLHLRAWPTAHTDHDLTVWDEETHTLFLGDLLFVDHLPVLDGRLRGWLAVMDELRTLDAALVVPGHGAPSRDWPAVLSPQRSYLEALQRDVRAALKARTSLARTVETLGAAPQPGWLLADHYHRRNLTAAYAELEWED